MALDSFHLCLTVPCSTVPSAVCVAARKKSLLVRCLLLESEELDGNAGRPSSSSGGVNADVQRMGGVGGGSGIKGGGASMRSSLENMVLDLPGAASAAVVKYMSVATNRVGGGGRERAAAGSQSSSAPERQEARRLIERRSVGLKQLFQNSPIRHRDDVVSKHENK